MDPLSARGRRLVDHAPMPPYLDAHFERLDDVFHPVDNPGGYIGLAIAENKLVWPLLEPKLTAPRRVGPAAVAYDEPRGNAELRAGLARLLGRTLAGRTLDPSHIAVAAGSGSVLENLFYVLAGPGDAVLVPTPSYAGFWADLETRDGLRIVPVHASDETGYRITTAMLDEAIASTDRDVRALLFTNPSNPLGTVATADEVRGISAWANDRGIHLVFDEVFALSTFGSFTSALSLGPLGATTHVVWAFSKDFAMSGVRCGVLVTENSDVMAAFEALTYWAMVSGDTQHLLAGMIGDDEWTDMYLREMRSTLRTSYAKTSDALAAAGIPHVEAEAAIFAMIDVRGFLDEPTWEAEERLWRRILDEANVNVTPGSACRTVEPGLMRIVYSAAPTDHVIIAIERMAQVLGSR